MPSSDFQVVTEIAQKSYRDPSGAQRPYLTADEVEMLSIPRGSLDAEERRQIESHVVHSFQFLAQIPWTQEYKKIPEIARAHHEKLNGKGYPYGLNSAEIPVQAKIMTICDIFDALSATDRPYKRAVPTDKALDILKLCVREEEIDAELFRLFLESQVYRVAVKF
jgi:HD-GYP domain-containing protein (c-di-GMP phosphodiesterase class II)